MFDNATGSNNSAFGYYALNGNTTGSNNIALGYQAGQNLTSGSNNIDIGSAGMTADSKTIRIGTQGTQTTAYVAGIYGTMLTGDAVMVNSAGKLGMVMSSARFKHDIENMGVKSSGLLKLRPVTFRYNNDPSGALQYGLVAEEVAKVYPELVSYGPDGKPMTVRYLMLSAMLLNELQKQTRLNQRQAEQIRQLTEQHAAEYQRLSAQMAQMKGMFEQAISGQRRTGSLAAAFNR